ncbi:FAD-dependent oxidoreductase [Dehalobacter sp. DCM]|uniref:oxidoreductase n=1 Tax=Dehalobacter sp. DCM TaxID=2907827 RepID=UPI003081F7A1|nr:FAD-dependent oxidoreductase [Dehalobacter sp. DCM]
MTKCKYSHLFTPITLGNTLFRNRIFASPTGYQNLNGDGYLGDGAGAAAYYERKAMGGAASVATFEGIVDGEFGKGGAGHICLDTPNINRNLSTIAHGIKNYGAVASLELAHTGMFANRDLSFFGAASQGIAYGPVECELAGRIIRPMDEEIIERTIRKYAEGAALAKMCGFGMVTVHAGHGWLLHQFLSPKTNTRTDKWGGADIENRARLAVSVCDAIRKAVGPGFPIEIRISGSECYDGGYGLDEGIAIAKQLEDHVDLIHVSAGNHEIEEVFAVTHPSMFLEDGVNVKYAAEIKKHVKKPVAAIGALNNPELMEEIIASGQADVVEAARQLLADPDFPNKVRSGNEDKAKKCMRCLSCFSSELTYGEPYCAINPETGREHELKYAIPTAIKKKVLVVGGGVGGMQAALTCSARGHEVILCEKSSRLGGVLRCEEEVTFKQPLDYYLNQQAKAVVDSNIDLRLNTEVTSDYAQALNADVIIAAVGAQPVKPRIPGIDGANVLSAQDAYTAIDKIGQQVVILGAGLVGIELGLHLISKGKKVHIVEMLDHISDGGNFLHILGLKVEMAKRGLEVSFKTKAKEIKADGVVCETADGEKVFAADTVIYAVGQKPLREEAIALNSCAPEFYQIGDCVAPRNITSATAEGFMIARNIGRF